MKGELKFFYMVKITREKIQIKKIYNTAARQVTSQRGEEGFSRKLMSSQTYVMLRLLSWCLLQWQAF
jgi:hypothetical protein